MQGRMIDKFMKCTMIVVHVSLKHRVLMRNISQ